ncbi:tetratricopeptide repeat protein [Oscillatoria amoena NRMC-F 0135]|nr:tetratricopeptide repeat protein [Oscillatoria amoena NRMC-F 0135]
MASIVPGFEYDIFISYRHKDNKYDGWVSEFVDNLKKEIAATFKEELSVYFDSNPHDGLLETQVVDKSLEGKLKCLIFIPILSQTYCDPNSYAWKNEFCAFNKLASNDQFGMYIRLANGNVNSRILPIRIHELDDQDNKLIETELGGTLRSLDFIYRTAGVNRPLRAHEDEPKENLNHTFYRDQINKVANTIKKTIAGIRMMGPGAEKVSSAAYSNPEVALKPTGKSKMIYGIVGALILLVAALYYFQSALSTKPAPAVENSIAVLPFADLSPAGDQEYFSDGLSEELLNLLARIPDLKVISRTSAFSFKGKNEDIRDIGKKLGVTHILEGSVRKSSDKIRITAQLILVSDGSHIWSKTYDRSMGDIFVVQDEIANTVVQELKITLVGKEVHARPANAEAYNLYLQGRYFFAKHRREDVDEAIDLFNQAIAIDNTMANAWAALSLAYASHANNGYLDPTEGFDKARKAASKAISLADDLASGHYALASILATYDWDWNGAQEEFRKAIARDPSNIGAINGMANLELTLGNIDHAISLYQKALELDPLRVVIKVNLAMTLMHANHLDEAELQLNKGLELNPQFPTAHYRLGLTYLLKGNTAGAIEEIQKEVVEDWRIQGLAMAYYKAGNTQEADLLLKKFIDEFKEISAFQIAEIFGCRNEADNVFVWLDKAYLQRDGGLSTLTGNPWLKPFEKDQRYIDFKRKLNL